MVASQTMTKESYITKPTKRGGSSRVFHWLVHEYVSIKILHKMNISGYIRRVSASYICFEEFQIIKQVLMYWMKI